MRLTPVDSEHSAIFQSLEGNDHKALKRILLTASGGPFRGKKREELRHVTVKECMNHPTWSMGTKVTLDSSTLANKGLEVIEAHWLFEASYDQIVPIIHPQSIVHSLVEYQDGAVIAQLGAPDMRLPIQYALSYPERWPVHFETLDLLSCGPLTFFEPDREVFRALPLAIEAGRAGGIMPTVSMRQTKWQTMPLSKDRFLFLPWPTSLRPSSAKWNLFPHYPMKQSWKQIVKRGKWPAPFCPPWGRSK